MKKIKNKNFKVISVFYPLNKKCLKKEWLLITSTTCGLGLNDVIQK